MGDISEIFQIVKQSENILISLGKSLKGEGLLSGITLATAVASKYSRKKIRLSMSSEQQKEIEKLNLDIDGIDIITTLIPQSLVIEIDNSGGKLASVEWKKEDNKVKCYIAPKNDVVVNKDSISYSHIDTKIDFIITLGAENLDDLGDVYKNSKKIFENSTILNLRLEQSSNEVGNFEIQDTKSSTYSELVFELVNGLRINLSDIEAEILLLGIYLGTDNFTNIKNPKTFSIASKLMALGANLGNVQELKKLMESYKEETKGIERIEQKGGDDKSSLRLSKVNKVGTSEGQTMRENLEKKSSDEQEETKAKNLEENKGGAKTEKVIEQEIEKKEERQNKKDQHVKESDNEEQPMVATEEKVAEENLQIPLRKAKSIPSLETNQTVRSSTNPSQPNFIQPPPIAPLQPQSGLETMDQTFTNSKVG